MATKTFKVSLSLDNPRIIQSGINVRSFDKQSIKIAIELTKNSQVYQIPTGAQIKISLLKLARQEQKIILDVPFTSADSIDWVVPDYLDGYQGEVRVGVYLIVGTENIDVGYFNITSSVSDIDSAAEEFTESVLQGWAIEDLTALLPQFQAVLDETTGKDVISAPEIILARNGEVDLKTRLDKEKQEVTAQLAHKATKGEIGLTDLNKNITQFDETWFTDTVKQQWTGTTPVNATPPNKGVTRLKLADNAIGANQTDFLETSSNLFNKNDFLDGYRLNVSTGALEAVGSLGVSDYIEVTPNTPYIGYKIARVHFFDENFNWLSTQGTVTDEINITTPVGAYFLRTIVKIADKGVAQLNQGSELLPFEQAYVKLKNHVELTAFTDTMGYIIGNPRYIDFDWSSKKLKINNGGLNVRILFKNTGYAPSEQTVELPTSGYHKLIYRISDKAVNIIPSYSDTPNNSVMFGLIDAHTEQVYHIGNYYVNGQPRQIESNIETDIRTHDQYIINGYTDVYYEAPIMPDKSANVENDLQNMMSEEMIGLWDALLNNYPNYLSKTIVGGNEYYEFNPEPVPVETDTTKFPKIILISGVHGSEKAGVYALYLAMKEICESWSTNEALETLRWNVRFIVAPLVNKYGFDNWTRKNENGVDLARNFPEGWVLGSDPSSNTYGGTEPLSEPQAQFIDSILQANKDAIYFGSFHNFSAPPTGDHEFIWNAGATKLQTQLGKQLISRVTRKWKPRYDWLPQDESTFFGYANGGSPNGSEGKYAASLGIQGGTFEICRKFYLEPLGSTYNSMTFTLGVEVFINWLILNLKNNVDFYNNH